MAALAYYLDDMLLDSDSSHQILFLHAILSQWSLFVIRYDVNLRAAAPTAQPSSFVRPVPGHPLRCRPADCNRRQSVVGGDDGPAPAMVPKLSALLPPFHRQHVAGIRIWPMDRRLRRELRCLLAVSLPVPRSVCRLFAGTAAHTTHLDQLWPAAQPAAQHDRLAGYRPEPAAVAGGLDEAENGARI